MKIIKENHIPENIIRKAVEFVEKLKGSTGDLDNHVITIVFPSGVTKEEIMQEGMLGNWFVKNGFNVSCEVKDVEYMTKGDTDWKRLYKAKGNKAWLRNRTVATVTW